MSEHLVWARGLRDALGRGVDEDILYPVAAFRALGAEPYASCQGHLCRGLPYPWIDFRKRPANNPLQGLPCFHLVAKGTHGGCRLVPRSVDNITDFGGGSYTKEREELLAWGKSVIEKSN